MIHLNIENSPYAFEVEFRHVRKEGPHPALGRRSTVAAITTCVIVATEFNGLKDALDIKFAAVGNAVCERGDNFSRRVGRWQAFVKAVKQCGMLHRHSVALLDAYHQVDPDPPLREPHQLTAAEKTARWEAGWEKRKAREIARGAGGGK